MSTLLERQRERFSNDPGDRPAFQALEEALFLAGQWRELLELYRQRMGAPDLAANPRERARLLVQIGQVQSQRLGDAESAQESLRAAIGLDPNQRAAWSELRRIHSERQQWDLVLQIGEAESALALPPAEQAALLAELGRVWLHELGDPSQALEHFERALALHPQQVVALEGAARAGHALRRPADAAKYWERLAQHTSGKKRAAALVAWAGLLTGSLSDPQQAGELYRRALTDDPDNHHALEALAAIAEASEQWGLLVDLNERRFAVAQNPEQRAALALETGRVLLELQDKAEAARVWILRAAELDPGNPLIFRSLAEVERRRGDRPGLRRALEARLVTSGGRLPPATRIEFAELLVESGEDTTALEQLQRASEIAPKDHAVLEALSALLERMERFDDLNLVLARRAVLSRSDPSRCAALLAELGRLQSERLGDREAARRSFEQAMQADPDAPGVAEGLIGIYRSDESWPELRALLELLIGSAPRERRAELLCELGELHETRLADPAAAGRAYRAALETDPACSAAHRALQRIAAAGGDEVDLLDAYESEAGNTTDPERLRMLVPELVERLESRGRVDAALDWLERWSELDPEHPGPHELGVRLCARHARDAELLGHRQRLDARLGGPARVENRCAIAELHAGAGHHEEAIAAYRWALELEPTALPALEALAERLEAADRPRELEEVLTRLVEALPAARRRAALDELASLREERLGDRAGAIEALQQLLALEGSSDAIHERLASLLERSGRSAELAAQLDAHAGWREAAGHTAQRLRLQQARVLVEDLGRSDEAIGIYRRILSADPECNAAWDGLEGCLRRLGDFAGLAELLQERSAHCADTVRRERCQFERSLLLGRELDRCADACELLKELGRSASEPALRADAQRELEALLESTQDWDGLCALWQERLSNCAADEAPALHERLGILLADRGNDPERAAEHLERAAALDPQRADLWQRLAGIYESTERPEDLARVLEAELRTPGAAANEHALRSRLAELHLLVLERPDRAREHYEHLLALDAGHVAAGDFLLDEAVRRRDSATQLRILEGRLAALGPAPRHETERWAERRAVLRLQIAEIRRESEGGIAAAIAALRPALDEYGAGPLVSAPLADLLQQDGRWRELADLCRLALDSGLDARARGAWLHRLARAAQQCEAPQEAIQAYRELLAAQPGDREARAELIALLRQAGAPQELAALLEDSLASPAASDRGALLEELAALLAGPLQRPLEALDRLESLWSERTERSDLLERALDLAESLGRHERVLDLLGRALDRGAAGVTRADLLARRARTRRALGGVDASVVDDLRAALALDAERGDLRGELRAALQQLGRWEEALDCLLQSADRERGAARRALLEEGAGIAERELSAQAALPWLLRLRHDSPQDGSVLARLAELFRRSGRPHDELEALDAWVSSTSDPQILRKLHLERARLFDTDLPAPGRLAAALESALRHGADAPELLERLDRLYREQDRPRERVRVLEARLASAPAAARIDGLEQLAAVQAGALAAPREAIASLLRAVALLGDGDERRPRLLRNLGDLLARHAAPDVWARCAEAELASRSAAERERRSELRRDLAAVYRRLGAHDQATAQLRAMAQEDPEGFLRSDALEIALLDGLRRCGCWIEYEARLAARLERHPDAAEGWLELARLREERLHRLPAAAEAYERLRDCDPTSLAALRGLRRVAERLGDWSEVARTIDWELDHPDCRETRARAALLRTLGEISLQRLGDLDRARSAHAAALEADPGDPIAHRALESILEAQQDWPAALDLYESEALLLGEADAERRQRVWLRVGEIARDRTGDLTRALRAYDSAAEAAPLDAKRLHEQVELLERSDDRERFTAALAQWCQHPDAQVSTAHRLRLARALADLGRGDEARRCADGACAADPTSRAAFDLLAELSAAAGDAPAGARALERAAELSRGAEAARRLLRAAQWQEAVDPQRAFQLARNAADADATSIPIQLELARLAEACGQDDWVQRAAASALARLPSDNAETREQRRSIAQRAGRSALRGGRWEAATRFFSQAHEAAPDAPETLAELGESLHALGDWNAARRTLEARLAHTAPDPDAARHHALCADCRVHEGEPEAALQECEYALRIDAGCALAHRLRVDLLRRAARLDAGIAALEEWARQVAEPAERAALWLEAARWERAVGGQNAAAERHLRQAVEAAPSGWEAWLELAELLQEQQRSDAALETLRDALSRCSDARARSALSLLRARILDAQHEDGEAVSAYREVLVGDPDQEEATAALGRLLRSQGAWQEAARVLQSFGRGPGIVEAHAQARIAFQLGHLLAGPLEDLAGAIRAYRRAVEHWPERTEFRLALAQLASHQPEHRAEALAHAGHILALDPTHETALRALERIAEAAARSDVARAVRALLAALGAASSAETRTDSPAPELRWSEGTEDPAALGTQLRLAVQKLARELEEALGSRGVTPPSDGDETRIRAEASLLEAEGQLAAPALLALPDAEVAAVFEAIGSATLESDSGRGAPSALADVLGLLSRRRVRRILGETSLDEIRRLDVRRWRSELRAAAAARVLAEGQAPLRPLLLALIDREAGERAPALPASADIAALAAGCPAACLLLRRRIERLIGELR